MFLFFSGTGLMVFISIFQVMVLICDIDVLIRDFDVFSLFSFDTR